MPRRSRAEIDTPPVRLVAPRLSRRLLGAERPCRGGALRTRVGHRLFRRRARSGHARRQRRSPAPAGHAVGSWTFSEQGQAECAEFIAERKVDVERHAAFTGIHRPLKTGVNAVEDALWRYPGGAL